MCLGDLSTEALHWTQVAMLGTCFCRCQTSPVLILSLLCMIALIAPCGHSCHVQQIVCTNMWLYMYAGAQVCEGADLHCLTAAYCGSTSHDVIAAEQTCFACDHIMTAAEQFCFACNTLKSLIVHDDSALTCCLRDGHECIDFPVGSVSVSAYTAAAVENSESCVISDNICIVGLCDRADDPLIHSRIY